MNNGFGTHQADTLTKDSGGRECVEHMDGSDGTLERLDDLSIISSKFADCPYMLLKK
jgi:hypothetical protein